MPIFFKRSGKYRSLRKLEQEWDTYVEYINSVRSKLPNEVFKFAIAHWHYSISHHRSLHDSWLEELSIREVTKKRVNNRKLEIVIRLLGPFHDGHTILTYRNVHSYKLHFPKRVPVIGHMHGDWYYDEIRLSKAGHVIHDIVFLSDASIYIECESIHHSTNIPNVES